MPARHTALFRQLSEVFNGKIPELFRCHVRTLKIRSLYARCATTFDDL